MRVLTGYPGPLELIAGIAYSWLAVTIGDHHLTNPPMLTIRPAQMDVFKAAALDAFVGKAKEHVRSHFPVQWRLCGHERVERLVRLLHQRALDRYAISDRRGVMLYLTVALLLGADFDRDPMVPWAARELQAGGTPRDAAHDGRMERIADMALIYQERVSGQDNRALYRALLTIQSSPEHLIALCPVGSDPTTAILERLWTTHPRKAEYLGEEKLRCLIVHSQTIAVALGLSDFPAQSLLAMLHYMFGAGAHADPLVDWIGEILADRGSLLDGDRTGRLHSRSLAFLNDLIASQRLS